MTFTDSGPTDLETLDKLDEKRRLSARPDDRLTPEEQDRLNQLGNELRHLGLLMEDRDPEFQAYLKAKLASQATQRPLSFTREEVEENFEDAVALLHEIEEQED